MDAVRPPNRAGIELATPMYQWILLRAAATQDADAAITQATAGLDFASIIKDPEIAGRTDGIIDIQKEFGKTCNGVEIAFFSVDNTVADGDDFGFDLLAYRGAATDANGSGATAGGMPKFVCQGAAGVQLFGTGVCKVHPTTGAAQTDGLWVDTLVITDRWSSGVTTNDSANNTIATISFDLRGYRYLYLQTHTHDGSTSNEAGLIGAIISGF